MNIRKFIQCDVFSPYPTQGNGLATVLDAEGLSDQQMQRFAAWTHLAETTFLFPPTQAAADYRLRIMTPTREMPFAGHPTLGSCAAWLHAGGIPQQAGLVRQECAIGIVEIDVRQAPFAFVAPPTTVAPMDEAEFERIIDTLAIPTESILRYACLDNGPVWHAFQLRSAADVLALDANKVRWPDFKSLGFIGAHSPGSPCDYEVRMLAPSSGMREDPITGSLNAALAHWMHSAGTLPQPIIIAQGTAINRHGRVLVRPQGNCIWIGGETHILIEGTVHL